MRERGRKRDSGGGTGRERSKCSKILRGYPLGHLNKGYPGILCTFLLFHKSESPLKFTILKILTGMNRVWLPFFCGALGRLLPWGMRPGKGACASPLGTREQRQRANLYLSHAQVLLPVPRKGNFLLFKDHPAQTKTPPGTAFQSEVGEGCLVPVFGLGI